MQPTLDILVVCTGNICRSPYAEAALSTALAASAHRVSSGGTRALVGHPAHSTVVRLMERAGLTPPATGGVQLTTALIDCAHLVLTMTAEHRGAVLRETPAALRKTFTLKEFALLCDRLDHPEPARAGGDAGVDAEGDTDGAAPDHGVVAAAFALRSVLGDTVNSTAADVADPYGLDTTAFETMAHEIDAAVQRIAPILLRRAG